MINNDIMDLLRKIKNSLTKNSKNELLILKPVEDKKKKQVIIDGKIILVDEKTETKLNPPPKIL